ncbi:hypothetical protein ANCDUO_05942 [Ancylostoma duodenale]|uniref:Uncharacterized protein n=1 Tax=Ancylostoma duodenale TaxID=51022 RepID=A0A0C2GXG4_9BILA|nr:hypothetical protein ANCDUO_05942 [Ancylostoma duodenale]
MGRPAFITDDVGRSRTALCCSRFMDLCPGTVPLQQFVNSDISYAAVFADITADGKTLFFVPQGIKTHSSKYLAILKGEF